MDKIEFNNKMENILHWDSKKNVQNRRNNIFLFTGYPILILLLGVFYVYNISGGMEVNSIDTYCAHSLVGCINFPIRWDFVALNMEVKIPWGGFTRLLSNIPLAWIALAIRLYSQKNRKWKLNWISQFLTVYSIINLIELITESVIFISIFEIPFREMIVWGDTLLILFLLSLSIWNPQLIVLLRPLSKIYYSLFLLLVPLTGVFFATSKYFVQYKMMNMVLAIVIIINLGLILTSGRNFSEQLWNKSPWRVEREMLAKEKGEDSTLWAPIRITSIDY